MIKILFVCLGNICRSPLAEAIFNHKINKSGLDSTISSDSSGTASYHVGESPDPRTIKVAHKHGVPIDHRGRQYQKRDADTYDHILAMDHSNHQNIVNTTGHEPSHLYLMRDFDPEGKGQNVPDPWYGGPEGFEEVYQILDRSIDRFIDFLKKEHNL